MLSSSNTCYKSGLHWIYVMDICNGYICMLEERKILEILKNHFGQFHKLNNDNSQLHTMYYVATYQTYTISFLLPRS